MSGVRGLIGGLIAAVLVIGLIPGLAIARPGFNLGAWDVVLTYDVDSNGDITYTESGNYDKVIDCTGGWTKVLDTKGVGPLNQEIHEFAIDYVTGKFAYIHIEDGTQIERHSVCSAFDLPAVNEPQGQWLTETSCLGACLHDTKLHGVFEHANVDVCACEPFQIEADDAHPAHIVYAATLGNTNYEPFTGIVNLDTGGIFNEEGDPVVWVNDWVVIGGRTWNSELGSIGENSDCNSGTCGWDLRARPGTSLNGFTISTSIGGYGNEAWVQD